MTTGANWTEERVQQLRNGVNAGLTCSQIATEIGMTRNAVIGKIHRLGLSTGRRASAQARPARASVPARVRRAPVSRLLRAFAAEGSSVVRLTTTTEAPTIESTQRCSLLELSGGRCRWPISEPGKDDFAFCGNDAMTGISYCVGHARIAYRLPSGRMAARSRA